MDYLNHNRLQSNLEDTQKTVVGLEETKTKVMQDYRKERERYTNLMHFVTVNICLFLSCFRHQLELDQVVKEQEQR